MKKQKTAYQRVLLDDKWYVIIKEDEFRELTKVANGKGNIDVLDAMSVSDQRLADRRTRDYTGLQRCLSRALMTGASTDWCATASANMPITYRSRSTLISSASSARAAGANE